MVKFKTLFNDIDTEERISKRLARAGLCSRREAERWINAACGLSTHVEMAKACNGALGWARGLSACW